MTSSKKRDIADWENNYLKSPNSKIDNIFDSFENNEKIKPKLIDKIYKTMNDISGDLKNFGLEELRSIYKIIGYLDNIVTSYDPDRDDRESDQLLLLSIIAELISQRESINNLHNLNNINDERSLKLLIHLRNRIGGLIQ